MRKRFTHFSLIVMLLVQPVVSMAAMQNLMTTPGRDASVTAQAQVEIVVASTQREFSLVAKPAHPGCHATTENEQSSESIHSNCGPGCSTCCAMTPSILSFSFDISVAPMHALKTFNLSTHPISQTPPRLFRPPRQG